MEKVNPDFLPLYIAECEEYIKHYTELLEANPNDWYYEAELDMYKERLETLKAQAKK